MATEIRVPTLGESVSEATIGKWFKKPGDAVKADEPLVELETDKVTLEVNAPAAGVLGEIVAKEGDTVGVSALLGMISAGDGKAAAPAAKAEEKKADTAVAQASGKAGEATTAAAEAKAGEVAGDSEIKPATKSADSGPAVSRLAAESGVDPSKVNASGKDGRVTKGDMLAAIATGPAVAASAPAAPVQVRAPSPVDDASREERVKMTKLRQTIARRLKEAQATAAMLTTFNEVDMSAVMALRNQYKDVFEKKHGVKLGFMGFFVKACVQALKEIPSVNAEIDGTDIIYKNYYHVAVAVGTDKGLVVPVVRDADQLSIAGVEKAIGVLGKKAREGSLKIEDMQGGTFTISNGGVYGSLMSTPILNAPQSAILGMHKIQERPMVVGGQIVVRPMMYLAVSYDHRIIDGKEAVTFLVRIKEALEDPARLVLDL
ncbi:MAG TPA: 2-oxoglutarate dehydrogenase complex dihydrolipoyllysine-residue succinyltransferase [Bosea sp. (in: a-proteobacteria)]|jgi:2-oxoglutarate dehydrogenase E2 component (dihydrolipoamide succinyltransferase)|uniref:2-oxoglutarate dehydrogenase complex dihydrolipoyllysine-residue succinyltransferase n=1 Tax=Bosea sp. (in: a-proteobacteria) TaxID=1871050 RepID=UPI002DDD3F82|nr:2-oxoglutarate dehydrogenase complex dihydrolipoyllysine-residue succinyltransferase [Bosea sp. (in: a-proteobacteria)]HEV2552361.1 2-oxoglutarate dehydrogenase complex dihydrolipoyllysine-residue succinyltransferase [Bosea sp. (in: a-proteobacteria)]